MKRTKLKDRILPNYTKGEEIFNMTSHIVGGALGIVTTTLCVIMAAIHSNIYGVISGAIFGASMTVLYTMSSIYHGLNQELKAKKVMQILDHCSIFFLIAGSYTPLCLCTLREYNTALGWTLFGIIWFFAILGIVLNSIDLKKYDKICTVCYVIMGWCIIIKANLLPKLLGIGGLVFLLTGGVLYTIGAILYVLGKKHKYVHSLFHIFVFAGSLLHFFCILFYVM